MRVGRLVAWWSAAAMAGGRRRRPRSLLGRLPLGLATIGLAVGFALRRRARREEDRWLDAFHVPEPSGDPQPFQATSPPAADPAPAPAPDPAPAPAPDPAPAPAPVHAGDGLADLLALSRQELYARAQARDVPGRSRMSKRELAEAIMEAEQPGSA